MRWSERIAVTFGWFALIGLVLVVLILMIFNARECQAEEVGHLRSFPDRVIDWAENSVSARRRGSHWLLRKRGVEAKVRRFAVYADEATIDASFGPALVMAIAWRESGWQEGIVGSRGEIGLMQIHGVALGRWRRRPNLVWHPALNIRLGVLHLQRAVNDCLGDIAWGLGKYATSECRPPRDHEDTQVIRWAYEIKTGRFRRAGS